MNSLDSASYSPDYLSQELVLKMELQKVSILSDLAALLDRDGIEDEVDRGIVIDAFTFITNPSEDLSEIKSQTTIIGRVLVVYLMQGIEPPAEIDAISGYLFGLQCISIMKLIEEELLKEQSDILMIQGAMAKGSDWAKTLSKGYKDDTFLNAFNELRDSIG